MTPTPLGQSENPATCAAAGIPNATTITDDNNGSGTHVASDSNATISVTITGTSVSFIATKLPQGQLILGVVVKGGSNGGNVYNYTTLPAGGVSSDNNLNAGSTGNGGSIAGISHLLFCYGTAVPQSSGGPPTGTGTNTPPTGTPTTTKTTTTTTTTTAVKGVTKHKKAKKHHKRKKHLKPKTIRKIAPSFTG